MSEQTRHYIRCDLCGAGDGLSADRDAARQVVRTLGWMHINNGEHVIDVCGDCVARMMARADSTAVRMMALEEMQP